MTTVRTSPEGLQPGPWKLDELLEDTSEDTLLGRFEELDALVAELEAYRPVLEQRASADRVLAAVSKYEELMTAAYRLAGYTSLWFSADTQCQEALALRNRVQQKTTELENHSLFFSLWWQQLEDSEAEAVLSALGADPSAGDSVRYLEELRRLKDHRLDEPSEKLINLKDADGISAVLTLYSMLTNAFEFRPEIEGAVTDRPLTRDQLMAYAHSPVADERAACYQEIFRVYQQQAPVLAQMYVHRVRDWRNENVELRGFASPIAVRNASNDIPDSAIAALLDVVREKAPIFRRYFARKAEWLGVDKLRRCDLYAPLASSEAKVDFGEAVDLVQATFDRFDERFGGLARRVFEQDHLDSEARPGKRGGAFCATVGPRHVPWVLINYSERPRDVAILAHEMGHAVHSMLAEHHSLLTQQPSLPLAETASVFAEILVTNRLLEQRQEPLVRRDLLVEAVDTIYATVLRQAYFVLFEIEAHELIASGGSPQDLEQLYALQLKEQFGDSVLVGEEFRSEWLHIPHIYASPFYCYAYSFGQLLVLALYQRYLAQGEGFVPGYLRLLSHGGAARPQEILEEAEIDITAPDFWRQGFEVVETLIGQLEELA